LSLEGAVKALWPKIGHKLPENVREEVEKSAIKKLSKSSAGEKIGQKRINKIIIDRFREAVYNGYLMQFDKGKVICPLKLAKISEEVEKIFNEVIPIINSYQPA